MAEYTYADVIIDPEDPRVEIGKEYYMADYPKKVIARANARGEFGVLKSIDNEQKETPFVITNRRTDVSWSCLIRKKDLGKKYEPFDLSKEEDRQVLRDKWLIRKYCDNFANEECKVIGFSGFYAALSVGFTEIEGHISRLFNGQYLLENFTFLDGAPCGKLVEEE